MSIRIVNENTILYKSVFVLEAKTSGPHFQSKKHAWPGHLMIIVFEKRVAFVY